MKGNWLYPLAKSIGEIQQDPSTHPATPQNECIPFGHGIQLTVVIGLGLEVSGMNRGYYSPLLPMTPMWMTDVVSKYVPDTVAQTLVT